MNALTTQRQTHSAGYSAEGLTIELAKMLALVAPTSMTTQQQELWLRAAVDALEDIRADEVQAISAEVRRSVSHPSKIVPEIAKLVAERRDRAGKSASLAALPPLPEPKPRPPSLPLSDAEIRAMPKHIRELGMRVGFIGQEGGRYVDTASR